MDQAWQERWHRPIPEPNLDPPDDGDEDEEFSEYDEEPDEEELQNSRARRWDEDQRGRADPP